MGKQINLIIWTILFFSACKTEVVNNTGVSATILHQLNNQLTEAIIQDGFSPPVASRIYAYTNIAAYECLKYVGDDKLSLTDQLNGFAEMPALPEGKNIDVHISMLTAFTEVATNLIYHDYIIENEQKKQLKQLTEEKKVKQATITSSVEWGKQLAESVLSRATKDNYKETRNYPLFVPTDTAGSWKPTPPTYSEAIEPYWSTIMPFVLDSATQFSPLAPAIFNQDKQSEFYQLTQEVYEAVNNIDSSQLAVARFWDCNPFVSINRGHLMYAKRQLTPGGHWMGIARTACQQSDADLLTTAEVYALTAIALADGFISCWQEKYRSNLIRPETYINQYIDADWQPILETPMFPEHTSGHSVISGAAATVLTHLFGDNFAYVDSVNVPFGLPPRTYSSFYAASDEAAISRLYGGIHYMPAIEYGKTQGRKIGEYIVQKVNTSKKPISSK